MRGTKPSSSGGGKRLFGMYRFFYSLFSLSRRGIFFFFVILPTEHRGAQHRRLSGHAADDGGVVCVCGE